MTNSPSKALRVRFTLMTSMVVAAAAMRILPHPTNFTPIAALALFGAATFDRRSLAFLVPLLALFASDVVLEITSPWGGFHATMPVVYGSFACIVGIGFWLRNRKSVATVAGAALASSVLFFIVTNLGMWATGSIYPHTLAGLVSCYEMALPFFEKTLVGDLFYTATLFGAWALAETQFELLRRVPATHAAA